MIESLFQRLSAAAAQAGPRDPEAEALIQQRFQSMPGAAYSMAQTLIVQERALQEAEARLGGAGQQGSFLPGGGGPAYRAAPPYAAQQQQYAQQPQYQQAQRGRGGGVGSFLAGAGQMALGVGGGILVADAAMALAQGLFGGGLGSDQSAYENAYDDGYQRGFEQGQQEDSYQQDDQTEQVEQADYEDSGDFDGGDSDF